MRRQMLNNCSMYTKSHQITLYLYDGQGERAHSIRHLSTQWYIGFYIHITMRYDIIIQFITIQI